MSSLCTEKDTRSRKFFLVHYRWMWYTERTVCGYDEIGRHARFRFSCSDALGFESPYPYHNCCSNWYDHQLLQQFFCAVNALIRKDFLQHRVQILNTVCFWAVFIAPISSKSGEMAIPIVSKKRLPLCYCFISKTQKTPSAKSVMSRKLHWALLYSCVIMSL